VTVVDRTRRLLPAALLTCAVAVYNHFPLTYPDSGSYISNAYHLLRGREPSFFDRPLAYGLFLVPFATAYTIWLLPLAQGLLVALVVDLALRSASVVLSTGWLFALFAALTAFTSLAWFSGQIMPDILASLVILLFFVTVWGDERLSRPERWTVIALLAFAIASHLSHVALYGGLLVVGLVWRAAADREPPSWRRLVPIALRASVPLVMAVGVVIAPNYLLYREPVLSRSSDLFYLAHLVHHGLAQRYLDRACPIHQYLLCSERAALQADADWFLWSATGPRKRYEPQWQRGDTTFLREARAIVAGTVRQEWTALIRLSLSSGMIQLVTLGAHPSEHRFSPTVERAMQRICVVRSYRASRQAQGTLRVEAASAVQYMSAALGLLLLLGCLPLLRGRAYHSLRLLIGTVCVGVALNAFVLASLSIVHNRYQSRVVWLVPLLGVVAAAQIIADRGRRSGRGAHSG
jgi:hypothetical protein